MLTAQCKISRPKSSPMRPITRFDFMAHSQIDQTPTLLLGRPCTEWVVTLLPKPSPKASRPCLRWRLLLEASLRRAHSSELLRKEWVVSSLGSTQPFHAATGRIDKGSRRSVLRWYAKVSHVPKRVLPFSRREQRVEAGMLWIHRLLVCCSLLR